MAPVRTVEVTRQAERRPMSGQREEAQEQHMLLLIESAQRAGRSEREISEIVDDAVQVDADTERAA
jgi:hypothetical protein